MQRVTNLEQILAMQRGPWPEYWISGQGFTTSGSETSGDQEDSYQVFALPPSPGTRLAALGDRIVTPGVDDDEADRELEIIHRNTLYTIV